MELVSRPSRFTQEQKARAVRMVHEAAPNYPTQWPAIVSVAEKIGVSSETLRKWVRQAEIDGGQRARLYALFEYIDWWNHRRLHGEIGLIPPAEREAAYYAQPPALTEAGSQ